MSILQSLSNTVALEKSISSDARLLGARRRRRRSKIGLQLKQFTTLMEQSMRML
jgi:hypothetical protein